MIFIHGMKIQLWDYSDQCGNIKGIIFPIFSFFWMILSAFYYFLIRLHILNALQWLSDNLTFSFFIGFFYGVFVLDVIYSTQLMVKIKQFAKESEIIVRIEELREEIHTSITNRHRKSRLHFFFSLRSDIPLHEILENYQKSHLNQHKSYQKRFRKKKDK